MIKAKTTKKAAVETASKAPVKKAEVKHSSQKTEPVKTVTSVVSKTVTIAPVKKTEKVINPATGGVGRRKSSVARVWLKRGTGVLINGKTPDDYFQMSYVSADATRSLKVCSAEKLYQVVVNVIGGGIHSQAGAVRLGIARALVKSNEEYRTLLRSNGLLTVDSRVKERKKPGQKAARRKFQFVKR